VGDPAAGLLVLGLFLAILTGLAGTSSA